MAKSASTTAGKGAGKAAAKEQQRAVKQARKAARKERRGQLRTAFRMTREADRWVIPLLVAVFLVSFGALFGLGLLLGHVVIGSIVGLFAAVVATMAVFGRRAQKAVYASVAGQVGAALGVLQSMPKGWKTTQALAFTRDQDLVHRVIGRPGIVLVGEGSPRRVANLLATERKRHTRVAPDVPVYDVSVGDEPGQVPLPKLRDHLRKLPRNIKPRQITPLEQRLRALGGPAMPIPKGYIPKSPRQIRRPR